MTLAFSTSVLASSAIALTPEQHYQLALEARTVRSYPLMMTHLRHAAGSGDVAAQELLASMLLAQNDFYGGAVRADPCEAAEWMRRAAAQGSVVARHQRLLLNGMRDLADTAKACAPRVPQATK